MRSSSGAWTTTTASNFSACPGLDQKRNILHHQRLLRCRITQLLGLRANQRVHDRVQLGPLRFIGEDDRGQSRPIQRPVGQQYILPKGVFDRTEPGRARFNYLARQLIGIDDYSSQGG